MKRQNNRRIPRSPLVAECLGTALLLSIGLSLVIVMFGTGSPMAVLIPNEGTRRLITGFLFGTTGAAIALSSIGKESGAHINPVVTLGFCLMGKLDARIGLFYVLAQMLGAMLGSLPLLAWGAMGQSVAFGATLPGKGYTVQTVLMGEVVTTLALITGLCIFLGFRKLRPFTPAMFPFLYAVMVYAEAPISGTSTNPARSFGPAVISGQWQGWWIYWLGPLLGTLIALFICNSLADRIEVAKVYHFESDRVGIFRRKHR
ncbi:aquaporin [Pannus brasiliensis CCIBt3594]|uniref:Aquaporin n=1 Tax=Pannus brasiliensis CCIBt3594 TaxID=1427578 RepID=A0AAW9QX80_9CHRO